MQWNQRLYNKIIITKHSLSYKNITPLVLLHMLRTHNNADICQYGWYYGWYLYNLGKPLPVYTKCPNKPIKTGACRNGTRQKQSNKVGMTQTSFTPSYTLHYFMLCGACKCNCDVSILPWDTIVLKPSLLYTLNGRKLDYDFHKHNHTPRCSKRLVLQVYVGLNTLNFSAIHR